MLDAIAAGSGVFLVLLMVVGMPCAYLSGVVRTRTASIRPGTEHLCTRCRYDLSGLASDAVCPECGGVGRGVPISVWRRSIALSQYDHRARGRSLVILLAASVGALVGSTVLNLAWAELYRYEGWPPHVVENYGRAGLRDPTALTVMALWYLSAAVLVMPWVVFRSRRTIIVAVTGAMAVVAAIQAGVLLVHWHAGGKLVVDALGADGGFALGLLSLVLGLVLALVAADIRRPRRQEP